MNLRILLLAIFFTTSIGFSQSNTKIEGVITDTNNETLPFANIVIKGTSFNTSADENGKYSLNVTAGNHTISFSFLGYEEKEVNVSIIEGETKRINISLESDHIELEGVEMTVSRKKNTETALLLEMREAKQVVSAISAEQISKSTDGNAAEAVQRVPGITIIDGKFVMIRGLSERYNNVLLNNSIAPSTEIDKRTFSFDLIPTSALDKMMVYKTGSADKPGDFAGGIISVTTSESTVEFTKAEVGFGYRDGTSFKDSYQTEGSSTDWLGFDKNYRPLPDNFPVLEYGAIIPDEQANRLPNNFNPTKKQTFLDNSIGFSLGRFIPLKGSNSLFTVNGISYSNSYQNLDRELNRYSALNPGETRPPVWSAYKDNIYQNTTNITLLSNWILKLGERNTFKFKNLINQEGTNETTIRNGINNMQRQGDDLRNYYLVYQSRFIYTGQLEGEHTFTNNKKLDWVIGYNSISDDMPDFRRFRTFRPTDQPNSPYIMIDPPSTNVFDTGRYYGMLSEYSANNGINFTYEIERTKDGEDIGNIKLKGGYYGSYRKRDFSAQYFTYTLPGYIPNDRREELKRLPLTEVFNSTNVNDVNGWSLRTGTRPIDSYEGENTHLAGYFMTEIPLYKFDVTAGIRVEHNIQKLNSQNEAPVNVNNPITSVLPSLNVGYNLNENSLLRFAYSRTVNRPEFREIAPFLFYDYINDVNIQGNPNLETATIDNIDLRYEYYPREGEMISVGTFYKKFKNPIELTTMIVGESPQFEYNNADSADNVGVELELKKSFKGLTNSTFIDRLSANINASYIFSEVDLGDKAVAQQKKRALQGQSPYIINAALGYKDDNGFSANIIYNRFGDRIFSVSDNNFPSYYELSRDNIDFTVAKKINSITLKLGIQDLLNAKYQIFEDSNRDDKIDKKNDNLISSYKRGTRFTLNIAYNF